jgi:hypothetical protein
METLGEGKSKKNNSGCFKLVILGIGFLLLCSPLNPFLEFHQIGEEDYLTNSSWLVMTVLVFAYGWLAIMWLRD